MSQKIKVQDGIIAYSASDPTEALDITVAGTVTVTNEITVGSVNSPIDGIISTGDGTALDRAQLDITTGAYGDLFVNQSPTGGALFLNNVKWPTGAEMPQPGMYLGASDLNELEYYSFVIGYNPNDSLTEANLNALYPNIQPGQSVIGPTVLYMCVSAGMWRILGSAATISAPVSELLIGTGSGISSSPDLTFDTTTNTLTTSIVAAKLAESMIVHSSESIILDAPGIVAAGFVQFGSFATAPALPVNGMVYYNTTNNKFRGYQNGVWINLDGSVI